jgi:D-amino-acid oxidase
MQASRAIVIGCGVSGLSCAIRLAEAGWRVEIWARELPPHTTSNVAAALWYPFAVGPAERVAQWARASYDVFSELARDPRSGVMVPSGIEFFPEPVAAPEMLRGLRGFRPASPGELRGAARQGYVFDAPVIETPIYLEHLVQRFRSLGGGIAQRACAAFGEAFDVAPLVVNCAGLGARELADDASVHPIRGQVVRVERGAIERFSIDDHDPRGITYVIPRSRDCVLGGSSRPGSEDLTVDLAEAEAIRERCIALEPGLATSAVLSHAVGLRPGRPTVRLDAERVAPGKLLVHDYGHGGAGVTLSWGCAAEVLELALRAMPGAATGRRPW